MKLPSGRMCAVRESGDGGFVWSVYPATSKQEVVEILKEWLSVNRQDEGVPFVLKAIEDNK